jgi:hypothetical protein
MAEPLTEAAIAALLADMRPGDAVQLDNVDPARDDEETMRVERHQVGYYGNNGKWDWEMDRLADAAVRLHRWGYRIVTWRGRA